MACRYYDDLIVAKLQHWLPANTPLRILKPDESKRLFELTADDLKDNPFKLPIIALSRSNDIELLSTIKSPKSFDGLKIFNDSIPKDGRGNYEGVYQFNVLPIKLNYQIDIYTKTYEEADEYVRSYLFKLINNPTIKIEIPYNNSKIEHIANIRVLTPISDTSNISERIFSGQFTRFTIQLELQDAFLFSIPYRINWRLYIGTDDLGNELDSYLELTDDFKHPGELEKLDI